MREFVEACCRHGLKAGKGLNVLREIIVAYLYFGLFFRFRSQTPGKRLLRLKVVDLKGRARLSWYQCFERAHGYNESDPAQI